MTKLSPVRILRSPAAKRVLKKKIYVLRKETSPVKRVQFSTPQKSFIQQQNTLLTPNSSNSSNSPNSPNTPNTPNTPATFNTSNTPNTSNTFNTSLTHNIPETFNNLNNSDTFDSCNNFSKRKCIYLKTLYSSKPYCYDKISIQHYINMRLKNKLPLVNPFNVKHLFTKNEVNYLLNDTNNTDYTDNSNNGKSLKNKNNKKQKKQYVPSPVKKI